MNSILLTTLWILVFIVCMVLVVRSATELIEAIYNYKAMKEHYGDSFYHSESIVYNEESEELEEGNGKFITPF